MPDALTRLELSNFTAFQRLDLQLSPGLNVLVGDNATGKTHLLKLLYAACEASRDSNDNLAFPRKLASVFLPYGGRFGRLAHRTGRSVRAYVRLHRGSKAIEVSFSNHTRTANRVRVEGTQGWTASSVDAVYVPVKEMLAHAPGFRSLHASRAIQFESIYADTIDRAYLPPLKGPPDKDRRELFAILQEAIDGRIITKDEVFFLRDARGELEFQLVAEGLRKFALLWLLVQNGSLAASTSSVLCWDEPEANLNPRLLGTLVEALLKLQRMGTQVFLATHDYVVLKEIHLRHQPDDKLLFHALYRVAGSPGVQCASTDSYYHIHPNAIADTFAGLFERDVQRIVDGASQ